MNSINTTEDVGARVAVLNIRVKKSDVDALASGKMTAEDFRRRANVPAAELKKRRNAWKAPKPRYTRGVLAKYASTVTSASLGAVTDQNLKL